jgi:25S rRNA (uracil2843-N3)-methyltransferase
VGVTQRKELQEHCKNISSNTLLQRIPTKGPKKPPRSNRPKDNSMMSTTGKPTSSKKPAHANTLPQTPVLDSTATALPIELQQTLLSVFSAAFPLAGNGSDLKSTVQTVKGYLYNRDFANAFGKPEYLSAYALRWSAARALAYADIFARFDPESRWLGSVGEEHIRVACIGGGAGAESVALAGMVRHRLLPGLRMEAVDVADWSACLDRLQDAIVSPPPLSKHASESVRAASRSLLETGQLVMEFRYEDVLENTEERLRELTRGTKLVTIMFTLNELFTTSIAKTTALLLKLTDAMDPSAWLLVVDSPGSYSEVKLGKSDETKKYPMKWLLDHTLLEVAGEDKWKKEVDEDSKWFRLDSRLKYAIELEDMRYQIHVYQRCAPP